ncbi:hypothetical protein Droror1_Dr00015266 [Drosera rotundifolia]
MTLSSSVLSPPPPSAAAAGIFHRDPFPSSFVPLTTTTPSRHPTRLVFFQPRAAVSADRPMKPISELSFYELLGIGQTGTLPEIKQAYKQLARKYHPDVSPPGRVEEYTERFIRVQEAYETLSDPRRREMYDRVLRKGGMRLAFSSRNMGKYDYDEVMENKSEWKNRWQTQLSCLKKRSIHKDTSRDLSWGAQMRRQRDESPNES